MNRPTPLNREFTFKENEFIVSKTDTRGKIIYCNEIFINISAYDESELLGKPHNIIRHPDMPKTIFKLLWETISQGKEIFAYVKNLRKDGGYYWVYAHVTPTYDDTGKIKGYHSVRRKPRRDALEKIEPIYKLLIEKERSGGLEAGVNFLMNYLKERKVEYDEFIFTL